MNKMVRKLITCCYLLLVASLMAAVAQESPQVLMKKGEKALFDGDPSVARIEFAKAVRATVEGTPERAQAEFGVARALEELYRRGGPPTEQIIASYEHAIQFGTPDIQRRARNNLGVFYIRQKDYQTAVDILSKMNLSDESSDRRRAIYQYNMARALDLSGDGEAAFANYAASLQHPATSRRAAGKAFALLSGNAELRKRVARATALADHLLTHGQPQLAYRYLLQSLESFGDEPDAQDLLVRMLLSFQEEGLSQDEFFKKQWRDLSAVGEKHDALAAAIDDIGRAYLSPISIASRATNDQEWELSELHQLFRAWRNEHAPAFSDFLKWLGDEAVSRGETTQGLSRYVAAWNIDRLNTDAALRTSTLFLNHPNELTGNRNVLKVLSQTYRPSGPLSFLDALTPKRKVHRRELRQTDYDNLTRMYVVLAKLAEPEFSGALAGGDTATEQLKRAVRTGKKSKSPEASPPPGLYMQLANSLEASGNKGAAAQNYAKAAKIYRELGHEKEARVAASKVSELQPRNKWAKETSKESDNPNVPPVPELPSFMTTRLNQEDLLTLSPWRLDIMLHEIYARLGLEFREASFRQYFQQQPWYEPKYPPSQDPYKLMNDVQRHNSELIQAALERTRTTR